jgi:hypothetical protein
MYALAVRSGNVIIVLNYLLTNPCLVLMLKDALSLSVADLLVKTAIVAE